MQNTSDDKYLNTLLGSIVIEELARNGVSLFCMSPGSRSTPLIAAAASNDRTEKIIIYDERSSAFFALGYGQAKNIPAAVITTSGTAVANLFPAIVEASMSNVPLIVLTADRPFELQDVGTNQTIYQENIFGKYVRWFCNIPSPGAGIKPEVILSAVNYAVYISKKNPAGPVHLNFMFREPLEPSKIHVTGKIPHTVYGIPVKLPDMEAAGRIREIINNTSRGLLSIGRLASDEDRQAASDLADKLGWPVYADITSGLRLGKLGTNIIKHFDQELLRPSVNKSAAPKTVLHLGGPVTSKRYLQFLSQNRPESFIVVKPDGTRYDPIYAVTEFVEADISHFCNAIASVISCSSTRLGKEMEDFKNFYESGAIKAQGIIEENFKNEYKPSKGSSAKAKKDCFISEVSVARMVAKQIPEGSALFLSSSMPIRDMELYGTGVADRKITVGTNRGASGIDGIISSAAGFCKGTGKKCTVIAGDIAFIHDLNSLSFLQSANLPLIIIVINNHGGGIFDFLPISSNKDIFEKYFVTPHNFSFKGAAEDFGIDYYMVQNCKEFEEAYKKACSKTSRGEENKVGPSSAVIEVLTDRQYNFNLRRKIKKEIIDWLNSGGILDE